MTAEVAGWASDSAGSCLTLYWGGQALLSLALLVHATLARPVPRKGRRSPDQPLAWSEFRKRRSVVYALAVSSLLYISWRVVGAYCWGGSPGPSLAWALLGAEPQGPAPTDATCALLALALYTLHAVQRLYECARVSIHSRAQVVSPLALLRDHTHHIAAALSLLTASPPLVLQEECVSLAGVHWVHLPALALFYWASRVQHDTHQQLATLRRNKSGHIVTTGYKAPRGSWFDTLNVSCPHYLAEILIHVAVGVALHGPAPAWWALTAHVTLSHLRHALDTQRFYRAKFDDYPPHRNMIIPYVL